MRQLSRVIGTMGGIGYIPLAPGTVASVATAGLWYWWYPSHGVQWVVCLVAIVAGIWAAGAVAQDVKRKDPSEVVIDEFAGMWLALAGLPKSLPLMCIALLLFRCLDIVKVPPMKQLERLPGGTGIVLDDIAAGLLTHLVLVIGLRVG